MGHLSLIDLGLPEVEVGQGHPRVTHDIGAGHEEAPRETGDPREHPAERIGVGPPEEVVIGSPKIASFDDWSHAMFPARRNEVAEIGRS
jgi:hypothetical protein